MAPKGPSPGSSRLDALVDCSSNLISNAISKDTKQSYESNFNGFISFLRGLKISSGLPVNPGHEVLYISHLYQSGLAYSTILSKLSSIAYFHKLYSHPDPTTHFLVQKTLLGVKKLRPSADIRQPLTFSMLLQIMDIFSTNIHPSYPTALYKAMISVSFFACLRPGEVTHSQNNIQFKNVLLSHNNLAITFQTFKHYHGRPVTINIPKQGGRACPVYLLSQYLSVRGRDSGPLFVLSSSKPVPYSEFRNLFAQLNSHLPGDTNITPHSCRIGGATHASITGMSQDNIQRLGRWHSSAYKNYIRIDSFSVSS